MATVALPPAPRIAPATPNFARAALETSVPVSPSPLTLAAIIQPLQFRRSTTLSPVKSLGSSRIGSSRISLPSHAWSGASAGHSVTPFSLVSHTPTSRLSPNAHSATDTPIAASLVSPDAASPLASKLFMKPPTSLSAILRDVAESQPTPSPLSPLAAPLIAPFHMVISPSKSYTRGNSVLKSASGTPLVSRAPSPAPAARVETETVVDGSGVLDHVEPKLPSVTEAAKHETQAPVAIDALIMNTSNDHEDPANTCSGMNT